VFGLIATCSNFFSSQYVWKPLLSHISLCRGEFLVRVTWSLVFCVVLCRSLFDPFVLHCNVCSLIYGFWLSVWYLQTFSFRLCMRIITLLRYSLSVPFLLAIILSVLWITASHYLCHLRTFLIDDIGYCQMTKFYLFSVVW
jgi:hypothetical protein